jgi:hypothetical protein
MESVGGRYINATLNLFHGRGQSHHQGTAFLQTFPAQGPGSRWLNYEGLGACLALPKVAGSLFQMGDKMGSTFHQPKSKVVDPRTKSLKT